MDAQPAAGKRSPRSTKSPRPATSTSKRAPHADLDNALFLPRLDLLPISADALEGAGPEYGEILESICGVADDSQDVERYDGTLGVPQAFVAAHQQPVAQVQWNADLSSRFTQPGNVNGVRWGSGTMIGPDLFLTCGHLFDADPNGWMIPRQNGTNNAISPQQVAQNMHLNFLFQVDATGVLRAEQSFPITQLVEFRLGGLDMALCRIGGSPGSTYGWSEFATADAAVGDMLAVIGHPAGRPKRIEAGPATQVSGNQIRYNDIDTLGGNSGSGILQASSGRIVGVHTNGGCNVDRTGSNFGVSIAAIVAVSPTLRATTPSSSTGQANDVLGTALARDILQTNRATDTISTLASRDTPTTSLARDIRTSLANDVINTVRSLDSATLLALDRGTSLGRDTGFRDQITTLWGGDAGTFGAGDVPDGTIVEGAFDPGQLQDPVINPILGLGVARAHAEAASAAAFESGEPTERPFVQAGPHLGIAEDEVPWGEVLLEQLDAVIEAQAAVLESLGMVREALGGVWGTEPGA